MQSSQLPERAAALVVATARRGFRLLPPRIRKHVEDRVFYAIFHLTRVTNDHYPSPPSKGVRR